MSAIATPTAVSTGQRRSVLPATGVDAAFVVVLVTLGMVGLHTVFGGFSFLLVGLVGTVLGVAVAELARRWGQPILAEALVTLLMFLLLGGALAARHNAVGGVIPTAQTFSSLGHAGVYGWKELLTTAPPVGDTSNLLAIPYIIGLVGGVSGQSIASRSRSSVAPLVGPTAVLALAILLGARRAEDLIYQGCLFGFVGLTWIVVRYNRGRPVISGAVHRRNRLALSAVILAGSALLGGAIGPRLPGAGNHARVVLSRYVIPPFNASNQTSPLANFRRYTKGAPNTLYNTPLFTVAGLKAGAQVRIATMDAYDGVVWGFGAAVSGRDASESGDVFRRYGSDIPVAQAGETGTVAVHVTGLSGVWLPEIGQTHKVSFSGSQAGNLSTDFRYNTATATAAEPDGLRPGVTYRLQVTVPNPPSVKELEAAGAGDQPMSVAGVPSVVQSDADQWVGSAASAWAKVIAIATHLKTYGRYSDGAPDPSNPLSPPLALPGHNSGRLTTFLEGGPLVGQEIVGDDEQYAATMALMANAVGVPARVVLGAVVPSSGVVEGRDVHAWIEIQLEGLGWVPVYQSDFLPTTPATETPPDTQQNTVSSAPVQPPVATALRSPLADALASSPAPSIAHFAHKHHAGFRIPAIVVTLLSWLGPPALLIGLLIAAILGLKSNRRRQRRATPAASGQIAGAWNELVDVARDIGLVVPGGCTRREQALAVVAPGMPSLAWRADAAVFGPGDPTPQYVQEYWAAVDETARHLRSDLGRLARIRAALSLRSFRFSEGRKVP